MSETHERSFKLLEMVLVVAFGDAEEVVNVSANVVESFEKFRHLLLKDIGTVAESHGYCRRCISHFPKGKTRVHNFLASGDSSM